MVPLSIAVTLLAAGLTFVVQPLVGKLLLPWYGGASAVWTTCLVFFQVGLLAGYLLAHLVTSRLGVRRAAVVQVAIVAVPLLGLPIGLTASPASPPGADPTVWLLAVLVLAVGAPFVALTTTTPTLQAWLAGAGAPVARAGAFRLFAAGSAGSLAGLLIYPLVVERSLDLTDQTRWWSIGYVVFAVLVTIGALVVVRRARPGPPDERPAPATSAGGPSSDGPERRTRLDWVALAAIPAALVVGTTAHLSVDVAAVPLLWVVPLAIYLGTYVLAFAGPRPIGLRLADRLLPVLALGAVLTLFDVGDLPLGIVFAAQLGALAAVGLACHGRLVLAKPGPDELTGYDLAIAAGGALGGILAGLAGPLILPVPMEGAIALVLALVVRSRPIPWSTGESAAALPVGAPAGPWTVAPAAPAAHLPLVIPIRIRSIAGRIPFLGRYAIAGTILLVLLLAVDPHLPAGLVVATLLVGLLLGLAGRPLVFAAVVGGLVALSVAALPPTLDTVRTFYGVHRVAADASGRHALFAGTTVQGLQRYLPPDLRDRPIGYYHPASPIADVMAALGQGDGSLHVGVVGLGAGAIAAYGRPADELTFFEIDPAVEAIARDPRLFTYLADSPARIAVRMGDGRLGLAAEPPASFDLVVIDAFASDAIPVHLLTREAIATYLERLRPGGLVAFNVSNRYVALEPVLAAVARDLGLAGLTRIDDPPLASAGDADPSQWVVLSADPAALDGLVPLPGWRPLVPPAARAWTDRYSDLFGAMIGS